MKQATDRKNIVFKQPTASKLAKKHATTTSVVENHPSAQVMTRLLSPTLSKDVSHFYDESGNQKTENQLEKRLELNSTLICHLKLGKVIKSTYSVEFTNEAGDNHFILPSGPLDLNEHKISLEELLASFEEHKPLLY